MSWPVDNAPVTYWSPEQKHTIDMTPSSVCYAQIKAFEGFRAYAYKDQAGIWTIGYGHTYRVHDGDVIDVHDATQMLIEDVSYVQTTLIDTIARPLAQHEYDALTSFCYNIGGVKFGRSDVLRLFQAGETERAGSALLGWTHAGGKVSHGLMQRRKLEQRWLTGNPL